MKTYRLGIKTWMAGGRYQHYVYEIGVKPDRIGELSNEVVEALKKTNEKAWDEIPEGSKGLVAVITYKVPRKEVSRLKKDKKS